MPKMKKETFRIADNDTCLMVSRGKQKFFTEEKNYKLLIEFSRKFGAELQIVKVSDAEIILDLKTLAKNLCDPSYVPSKTELDIKIIESKLVPKAKIPAKNNDITKKYTLEEYIENTLKNNKKLNISELRKEWCDDDTDYKKLYNTFQKIKNNMIEDGWQINRISRGIYIAE